MKYNSFQLNHLNYNKKDYGSNFKFEKSVLLKSPDFLDESKTDENLYIYYSFDIKNTDSDIKNFKLNNYLELMNFKVKLTLQSMQEIAKIFW